MSMQVKWLVKSEPSVWSFDQQKKEGRTHWNGVRNYQASNNLKAMKEGDLCFFYHSNEGLEIVGTVKIVKEYYPDPTDEKGRFGMVDVAFHAPLKTPVTLAAIKAEPRLADFALVRQSRLSVMPVTEAESAVIFEMAGM